jgi:hypothetical protein
MKVEHFDLYTPRMQEAIRELQRLIRWLYPKATFQVEHGDDPAGIYLLATVDVEDTDAVVEVYIERLLELQIDEGLPLYVVPIRPPAHVQPLRGLRIVASWTCCFLYNIMSFSII